MQPPLRFVLTLVVYLLFFCASNGRASNVPLANSNIQSGLQSLALETTNGLASADALFTSALSNNPISDNALVLKSGTGLALLQQSTNFVKLLTAIGVTQPSQSIYAYDYQFPVDANGHVILSGNSTNIGSYIVNTLRPQISSSITNLLAVSTNISLTLTAAQTSTAPMAIDYADVQWALCMLYLMKSASHAIDSYNTTLALSDFAKAVDGATSVKQILSAYPSLLTFSTNASGRTLAAQSFTNAFAAYQRATNFVLTRRVIKPGYDNMFLINTNDPVALASMKELGAQFASLSASFTSTQTLPSNRFNPTPLDGKMVNLAALVSTTTSPRSWVGTNPFTGSFYNPGAFTDPTFSGVLPQQTATGISSLIQGYNRLYTYTPWNVLTIAGQSANPGWRDGSRFAAQFATPFGIAVNPNGTLFVADNTSYTIRKIATNGEVSTFAGSPWKWGTNEGSGTNALFQAPAGMAIDASGNLFVADPPVIRKITPNGVVSTFAGKRSSWGSQDGALANATFGWIQGLAFDSLGNLFVADTGNHLIRKISSSGTVTTLAGQYGVTGTNNGSSTNAQFNWPYGISVDSLGNVLVADTFNNCIRKISTNGVVSTLAGMTTTNGWRDTLAGVVTAPNVLFTYPSSIGIDSTGNAIVSDSGNNLIRKIWTNGQVSTLAGEYFSVGSQDGNGQYALFNAPAGICLDKSGSLYVADAGNASLRKASTSPLTNTTAPYLPAQSSLIIYKGLALNSLYPNVYGNPTSYTAANLPAGLSIDPSTGALYGAPTRNGTYAVTVRASNSAGSVSTTWSILVTNAPTPTPSPIPGLKPTPVSNSLTPLNFVQRWTGNLQTQVQSIASGGGVYIGYNSYNGSGLNTTVGVTTNGINWSDKTLVAGQNYQTYGVAYGTNNTWLGVLGNGSSNVVVKSTNNGSSWYQITNANANPPASQFNYLNQPTPMIYANGSWVFAGSGYFNYYDTNNGNWLSGGYQGGIWKSSDGGVTWTNAWSSPLTQNWNNNGEYGINALAYGDGVLVGVGANGLILSSTNKGATWKTNNSGVGVNLDSVAYGNGRFVVVGDSGALITSTNKGQSWSVGWSAVSTSVVFGNGLFVQGNGSVSSNAVTWSSYPNFNFPNQPLYVNGPNSMTYGNAGFVAAHYSSVQQSVSTNVPFGWFNAWTNQNATVGTTYSNNLNSLTPVQFAIAQSGNWPSSAVVGATSFQVYDLPSGLSMSSNGIISGTPTRAGNYTAIIYPVNASGVGGYISVPIPVFNQGVAVPAKLNFANRFTGNLQTQVQSIVSGGGVYIGYNSYNGSGLNTTVAMTTNGINWSDMTLVAGQNYQTYGVAYGTNNTWLGVLGNGSSNVVVKSTNNGSSWSQITNANANPPASQFNYLNQPTPMIYANGSWVFAGSGYIGYYDANQNNWVSGYQGGVWKSSDGGVTWTNAWSSPLTQNWNNNGEYGINALAYGNGVLVGVGVNGLVLTSTNQGTTWKTNNGGVAVNLDSVAFGNGRFVVGGDNGAVLTSTNNGTSWISQFSGMQNQLTSMTYGNGVFMRNDGNVSSDGVTWVGNGYGGWGSAYAYGSAGFLNSSSQSVATGVPQNFNWTMPTYKSGFLRAYFSQLVSAEGATSYIAVGLPPGISLNTSSSTQPLNLSSVGTIWNNYSGMSSGYTPITQTVLSGTPTQVGNYTVVLYPVNARGVGNYITLTINITP